MPRAHKHNQEYERTHTHGARLPQSDSTTTIASHCAYRPMADVMLRAAPTETVTITSSSLGRAAAGAGAGAASAVALGRAFAFAAISPAPRLFDLARPVAAPPVAVAVECLALPERAGICSTRQTKRQGKEEVSSSVSRQ